VVEASALESQAGHADGGADGAVIQFLHLDGGRSVLKLAQAGIPEGALEPGIVVGEGAEDVQEGAGGGADLLSDGLLAIDLVGDDGSDFLVEDDLGAGRFDYQAIYVVGDIDLAGAGSDGGGGVDGEFHLLPRDFVALVCPEGGRGFVEADSEEVLATGLGIDLTNRHFDLGGLAGFELDGG